MINGAFILKSLGTTNEEVNMSRPAMHIPQHIIDALGTAPDIQLAKIAKCSTGKIFQLRRAMNIPAYEPKATGAKVQAVKTAPQVAQPVAAVNAPVVEKTVEVVRLPDAVKRLFTEGKQTASGVLIPFEVFAAAAMEAMR
jgi:hypothetical protein